MALSSSCHPLVVNKPHPHSCCGASLQRQCLYFILAFRMVNIYLCLLLGNLHTNKRVAFSGTCITVNLLDHDA